MRSTIHAIFVSLHTNKYFDKNQNAKRFDRLFILQETGEVVAVRVPLEAVSIAEKLAGDCELGDAVVLVVDADAFGGNGSRATLSLSLVDCDRADALAA